MKDLRVEGMSESGGRRSPALAGSHAPLYRQLRPGPGLTREKVAENQRGRLFGAMIELAADRGYRHVTIRDLVQAAGVSKATFYQHFAGRDECLIATYDAILRGAARGVLAGERGGAEGRARLRGGLGALAELVAEQPKAARLVLIESVAAGAAVREHVGRRMGLFEALVAERFATYHGTDSPPPDVVKGIVAGMAHHARGCLLADRPDEFPQLVDPLLDWALSFPPTVPDERRRSLASLDPTPAPARHDAPPRGCILSGDRDLIVAAAERLVLQEGVDRLTEARVSELAGVSRRTFRDNFADVEDCLLCAVASRAQPMLEIAAGSFDGADSWEDGIEAGLGVIIDHLTRDRSLARLALVEFPDGGRDALVRRHELVAATADRLCSDGRGAPAGPTRVEASLAAVWAILRDRVRAGCVDLRPDRGALLAILLPAREEAPEGRRLPVTGVGPRPRRTSLAEA